MTHNLIQIVSAALFLMSLSGSATFAATKVSFPFTPISAASLPWWIAKESRFYEKYGLDVDMIYVGASPVIIQAMLGGQAGVGAGGGPPLVTNVLQGGDVVQVATTIPYAIQSLIVNRTSAHQRIWSGRESASAVWERSLTTRCRQSSSCTTSRESISCKPAPRHRQSPAFRRAWSTVLSPPRHLPFV